MACTNYDILVLTETWLKDSVFSSELFDSRYKVFRRDRETSGFHKAKDGGGVLIAVARNFTANRQCTWESDCEDLWVTVSVTPKLKVAICAVYIPPPVHCHILEHFLDKYNMVSDKKDLHIILIGDFNLSSIDWSFVNGTTDSGTPAPPAMNTKINQTFIDFTHLNNLMQCNNVANVKNKILDLVLVDSLECTVAEAPKCLSKIDPYHPPLEIQLRYSSQNFLKLHKASRLNFKKADYSSIKEDLGNTNWEDLFSDIDDPDTLVEIFYNVVNQTIERNVPRFFVHTNSHPPWFSNGLIRLIREKNKYRKRYNKYKNPMDKIAFKSCSKQCDELSKECYKTYINRIEKHISANPKSFWTFIKNKRGVSKSYPATMTDGSTTANDGSDVCNMFGSYFSSVYSSENQSSISSQHINSRIVINNSDSFALANIKQEDIFKKLKSLDITKGPGSDQIPAIFIKRCAEELTIPLNIIFNKSLCVGVFPEQWKLAKVVPIHKGDDDQLVSNYRPISILCAIAKVFEALICPLIQSYFKRFVSNHQHGFIAGRSTCSNLVSFIEHVIDKVDNNEQVDVVYTDFCKAFDKVSHAVLIDKLISYGFAGSFVKWLSSYLTGRFFYVVANGYKSDIFRISSGVPQGSHLGPLLFTIFINDLPDYLNNTMAFLFADDLKILRVIKSFSDVKLLQEDINRLLEWCDRNDMQFNVKKCSQITFTRKHKFIESNYNMNGQYLNKVEVVRDLGVLLDKQLTFIPHIDAIIKKAAKATGFIIRNGKPFSQPKTKILLFNCFVRSVLEYCSVVWRPHYATHTLRIERIQKRFLNHLAFTKGIAKRVRSYAKRLEFFNVIMLETRRDALDLLFLYKIFNNLIDCTQIVSKFNFNIPHKYPRKPIKLFYPPRRKTVLGTNSPVPRLCRLFNKFDCKLDMFGASLNAYRNQVRKISK